MSNPKFTIVENDKIDDTDIVIECENGVKRVLTIKRDPRIDPLKRKLTVFKTLSRSLHNTLEEEFSLNTQLHEELKGFEKLDKKYKKAKHVSSLKDAEIDSLKLLCTSREDQLAEIKGKNENYRDDISRLEEVYHRQKIRADGLFEHIDDLTDQKDQIELNYYEVQSDLREVRRQATEDNLAFRSQLINVERNYVNLFQNSNEAAKMRERRRLGWVVTHPDMIGDGVEYNEMYHEIIANPVFDVANQDENLVRIDEPVYAVDDESSESEDSGEESQEIFPMCQRNVPPLVVLEQNPGDTLVECPLCNEKVADYQLMHCRNNECVHSFCLACYQNTINMNVGSAGLCPWCRAPFENE